MAFKAIIIIKRYRRKTSLTCKIMYYLKQINPTDNLLLYLQKRVLGQKLGIVLIDNNEFLNPYSFSFIDRNLLYK